MPKPKVQGRQRTDYAAQSLHFVCIALIDCDVVQPRYKPSSLNVSYSQAPGMNQSVSHKR